jgi:hypothetical protein
MSYFGGLGAGRGWNTFKFILTPKEFESIFKELKFEFVITNSRVEIKYEKTEDKFIFSSFEDFFNAVLITENKLDHKEQWAFERKIRISIIDDISKIHFRDIINKNGTISNEYKVVRPTEPVINISPFDLIYFQTKESISVAYSNPGGTVGLELTYPKFVSFSPDFETAIETNSFETFNLFNALVKNIKAISNKAKVQSSTKLFRPNFWISPEAKKVINQNYYIKTNNLNII